MHPIQFRLELCRRPQGGSLQRFLRPLSWIKGALLQRKKEWEEERRGAMRGARRSGEVEGRERGRE